VKEVSKEGKKVREGRKVKERRKELDHLFCFFFFVDASIALDGSC
jgi:hypothetical protein